MSESTVRFAVDKGFFICENDVFSLPLPAIEKLTYLAMTRYAGSNNRAWPSYERLAQDASCGRKRVIGAVKRLAACKLISKEVRANRTNIYLVYPPDYYCEQEGPSGGVERTPQNEPGVSTEPPRSVQGTPLGCREDTPGVSTGHPKSNNINNKDHQQRKRESETGESEILKDEEQKTLKHEISQKAMEAIRSAFKAKGVKVTDNAIRGYLKEHSEAAVKAAIKCTDFNVARNPLAVITWMLSTGSYLMPAEKEQAAPLQAEERAPTPEEDKAIRGLIKETRAGLVGKTVQLA